MWEKCINKYAALNPASMVFVADLATQRLACTTLDTLLELLQDVFESYLALLSEGPSGLLNTAPLKVKAVTICAIGLDAHASRGGFLP